MGREAGGRNHDVTRREDSPAASRQPAPSSQRKKDEDKDKDKKDASSRRRRAACSAEIEPLERKPGAERRRPWRPQAARASGRTRQRCQGRSEPKIVGVKVTPRSSKRSRRGSSG